MMAMEDDIMPEVYEKLAKSYEESTNRFHGGGAADLPPLGDEAYLKATAALSMLSDAQEAISCGFRAQADDLINGAKSLICDIIDAHRFPR